MNVDFDKLPYRRGVGLCLFNAKGLVLVAERRDRRGAWQMPQGGVQSGEDTALTALREMKEEIGTDNALIIAKLPDIDLSGEHEPELPEFVAWKWVELEEASELIVPFKKPVYEAMAKGFASIAQAIKRGEELPAWKG